PNGRPLYAYVPWWISQASVLGWQYGVKNNATSVLTRPQGLVMSFAYFWLAGLLNLKQHTKQAPTHLLEPPTSLMPVYHPLPHAGLPAAPAVATRCRQSNPSRVEGIPPDAQTRRASGQGPR